MKINKEALVESIWVSATQCTYLGMNRMKLIALEMLKYTSETSKDVINTDYRKNKFSEWLEFSHGALNYEIYKAKNGIIQFRILNYNRELSKYEEKEYLVFDQNLNIKYNSNNVLQVSKDYEFKYEQEWMKAYKKYVLKEQISV